MKSTVRKLGFDAFDIIFRQAAFKDSERKIHQIAFPKHFDERALRRFAALKFMMHFDHRLDFGAELFAAVFMQVFFRPFD